MIAAQVPMTETYQDVEKLIYHMCHLFVRKFGGDFEELVSEANIVFMRVYERYEPSKGTFSNLLSTSIYRRFLDMRYQEQRRKSVWVTSLDNIERGDDGRSVDIAVDDRPGAFRFWEFVEGMSEDASTVLNLVLESSERLDIGNGSGRSWRRAVGQYLQDLGWAASRSSSTFNEIQEALV